MVWSGHQIHNLNSLMSAFQDMEDEDLEESE